MPLKVSNHPLVADSLRGLRDRSTSPDEFRALARKVITLLLYEATAEEAGRFGLAAYEVSNYAVPGGESRHNLAYSALVAR